MMGLYDIHRPVIKATLTNAVASENGKHSFIRGTLSADNSVRRQVTAIENQGDLVTLSDATGLIVIPEGSSGAKAGDEVDVLVLERRFN
jgi:molybdopterin biosynthesis enzyme